MIDRGQPVVIPQRETGPQQFIIGDDETELDLSVESRSFLERVNDQVRKKTRTIFDECHRKRRKTFYDMECFMTVYQWNQQYSWERIT